MFLIAMEILTIVILIQRPMSYAHVSGLRSCDKEKTTKVYVQLSVEDYPGVDAGSNDSVGQDTAKLSCDVERIHSGHLNVCYFIVEGE